MKEKKYSALDPIRTFYAVSELLPLVFKESSGDKKKMEARLKEIKKLAIKISEEKLIKYELGNWHPRYDNYINSTWELQEISLEDCGVWPGMGGLPYEFTQGNVVETAKLIQNLLDDKNKLTYKTSKVLYIEELKDVAVLIAKYFPIIVLEDNVIRNNKFGDKKTPLHKKCKYDIDDGNHRAIAYALLGIKTIPALVGKRIYKSDLLYN